MPTESFTTSDLATAAYLHMMGLRLLRAEASNSGKFLFIFDDPTGTADTFAYDFINSDCSKFDNHVRLLKKMIYKN